ncbi:receptor-like protein EIX1, partial [Neltuma alba]|uniref:receptor-like protein EIX1 n=1 Tax=Neltuma alba TaxID=207710 RepID=UPI0010A39C07
VLSLKKLWVPQLRKWMLLHFHDTVIIMAFIWKFFYALFALLLLLHTSFSLAEGAKCVENERKALLLFKQGIVQDDSGMLSTWRDGDHEDCCNWKGVYCSNETGHIQFLNLRSSFPLSGKINITSLSEFHDMEYLDLSGNDFYPSEIPESIESFTKLVGDLPWTIGNLSKLQHLYLGSNSIGGVIPFQLGNLSMLRTLQLGGNSNLTFDQQSNHDAKWLSELSSLSSLDLSSVSDVGYSHLWLQLIGELSKLRVLRLSGYGISYTHNPSLTSYPSNYSSSLVILDLSGNNLNSASFQWPFNLSSNLRELYLRDCNLSSTDLHFTFSNFQLSSLIVLDLSYNNLMSLTALNFGSNLQVLNLQTCSLLSDNLIFTAFNPNLTSLVQLDFSYNLLTSSSTFHWISNFTFNLREIQLLENLLEGPIPKGFGNIMNSLEVLDLSGNKLCGEIPTSLGNICTLKHLYLSHNNFSGELSNGNNLGGVITESHFNKLSNLKGLSLSGNSLALQISTRWIAPFQLEDLEMASCFIPEWFWPLIKYAVSMNISYNNFVGEIPNLSLKLSTGAIYLTSNNFEGAVPSFFSRGKDDLFKRLEQLLKSIDLSSNALTGEIPKEVVSLLGLVSLNLSRNKLSGKIPPKIGNLGSLEFLDLSRNRLSGPIPQSLAHIDRLSVLDLSNNHLSENIPKGTQLQSFNATSYEGNLDLCGAPLNKKCLDDDETPSPQTSNHYEDDDDDSYFTQDFYLSLGLGFAFGFWAFLGPLLFNRTWRQTYYTFVRRVTDRVQILMAIYVSRYLTNR